MKVDKRAPGARGKVFFQTEGTVCAKLQNKSEYCVLEMERGLACLNQEMQDKKWPGVKLEIIIQGIIAQAKIFLLYIKSSS